MTVTRKEFMDCMKKARTMKPDIAQDDMNRVQHYLAGMLAEARAAEREMCARIADAQASRHPHGTTHQDQAYASGVENASEAIAEAIRALG